MQMIQAYADAATVRSSKEQCKYMTLYGLIRAYVDSDTACVIQTTVEVQVWIIEARSLKVREMQEPQEHTQTQVSEERRQRVSQAKKMYNCYTEKNIVIVLK